VIKDLPGAERHAISRYSVAKRAGIDQAVLSRFIAGKAGMSFKSIDAVGRVLGLRLISDEELKMATKRTRRSSTSKEN